MEDVTDTKRVNCVLPDELFKAVKLCAADNDQKMYEITTDAVKQFLSIYEEIPPAVWPDNTGKNKHLNVMIPSDYFKRCKLICVNEDVSMKQLLFFVITEYLKLKGYHQPTPSDCTKNKQSKKAVE